MKLREVLDINMTIAETDSVYRLWDMASGSYPAVEGLTEAEVVSLFRGDRVKGIISPFKKLSVDMDVALLPPMVCVTSSDPKFLKLQNRIMALHRRVNQLLRDALDISLRA